MNEIVTGITRRRAVKLLALFGVSAPTATRLLGQDPVRVTTEAMRGANALIDETVPEERLEAIRPALQRNFDQFQIVRDLEIDDRVEPTPVFHADWR